MRFYNYMLAINKGEVKEKKEKEDLTVQAKKKGIKAPKQHKHKGMLYR